MLNTVIKGKEKQKSEKISVAYILADDSVVSAQELAGRSKVTLKEKAALTSTQFSSPQMLDALKAKPDLIEVDPPYDPNLLSKFIDVDEVHFRCSVVKITDAIGRGYEIGSILEEDEKADSKVIKEEKAVIKEFISSCNPYNKFFGTFTEAGIDFESVGWGCVEIIRSMDRKIRKIAHVQADRIRVLQGFMGFVETLNDGSKIYYQPFGQKVVSKTRKDIYGVPEPFDIAKDGSWSNAVWNLRDFETFAPTKEIAKSCSELFYIPKYTPKSTYYGIPDYISAVGYILGNIHIRDYFLQYFDHNAVPQYAVIIKGADLSPEVKNLIQSYFSRDVKGSTHKTLVIPIPAVGEIDVVFEKLENSSESTKYEEIRKSNQTSIMVAHGVSPAIIGIADAASLGSGKGTAQMENYRERIVIPYQRRWAEELNNLFKLGLGVKYTGIIFDPLSTEESSILLKDDLDAMDRGVITINQVRARNHLGPPVKGGDRLFVNTGSGPVFVDEFGENTDVIQENPKEAPEEKEVLKEEEDIEKVKKEED